MHMDSSELYGRSSRKELQGPRPTPLKIHKDSHKIRKPPAAPPASAAYGTHLPPQPPPRQPVIIYAVSPKVIHTNPNDFMNLVQRLTGHSSTTTSTSTTTTNNNNDNIIINNNNNNNNIIITNPSFYDGQFGGGAISPAARYATIEKANNNNNNNIDQHAILLSNNSNNVLGLGFDQNSTSMEIVNYSHINNYIINNNKGFFSGILSPGPASLPPITPNFFSPPSDAFFQDLISPAIHGGNINNNNNNNRNFIDQASSFFVSPRTLMASPTTPSLDHLLFTNIFSDNNSL